MQQPEGHDDPNRPTTSAHCAGLIAPLMHFARSRLHNVALAEDAVSETLLAALESNRSFPSAEQQVAWVYGVLRHKLVDQLRQQQRETPGGDVVADGRAADPGDWHPLGSWPCAGGAGIGPEQACDGTQFIERVHSACDALPPLYRRAFLMREVFDMDAEVICSTLGVTDGHLWVLLHRARLRLRAALVDVPPVSRRTTRPARPARLAKPPRNHAPLSVAATQNL
jgi:RNA polymerase sigma-70 factor (ECF subfamily)